MYLLSFPDSGLHLLNGFEWRDTENQQLRTPFAVHYEKICNHLREMATNSVKIHSLARKYKHLRINQIQLRFLHFNQHSISFLGIHIRHWDTKEKDILSLTPTSKSLTPS